MAAVKAVVRKRGRLFVLDNSTRQHVMQAALWLTNPAATPGLMLCGLCGNGKTTLAMAIAWVVEFVTQYEGGCTSRKQMAFHTAKEICRYCVADRKKYDKIVQEPMLIIDDLGEEPREVLVYGMPITPIIDLINERYARRSMTIVTSNLQPKKLEEVYGVRIYDRMSEIMTPIGFTNDSYRTH